MKPTLVENRKSNPGIPPPPRHFVARLFRNSSWGIAGTIVLIIVGILQISMITRRLDPVQFGVLAIITAFPSLVSQLLGFRTQDFVARYLTLALEKNQKPYGGGVMAFCFMLDGLTAALTALIGWIIGGYYLTRFVGSDQMVTSLQLYCLMPLLAAVAQPSQAALRVLGRFDLLFLQTLVYGAVLLTSVWVAFQAHAGLAGFVVAYVVCGVCNALTMGGLCAWQIRTRITWPGLASAVQLSKGSLREWFSFLFAGYIDSSLRALNRHVDILLLAAWRTPAETGLYKAAQSIISYLERCVNPVIDALFPETQRQVVQSPTDLKHHLWIFTLICGGLSVLGGMATYALAPYVIRVVMGPSYHEAESLVRVMIWAVAALATFGWASVLSLSLGRPWLRVGSHVAGTAIHFILLCLLIPTYGALGAALAYVTLYCVIPGTQLAAIIACRFQPAPTAPPHPATPPDDAS